jgi:hypothetical protein
MFVPFDGSRIPGSDRQLTCMYCVNGTLGGKVFFSCKVGFFNYLSVQYYRFPSNGTIMMMMMMMMMMNE